ncbi:hypothetical protein QEH59_02275 [Coraliomargarita sp. SDUM461004]|uniref:Prenyltransferase n=1 Tax=Thalassobacterium sedimentorum TaxID=3041258 RepID=A0ABU1AFA8_9BACT|nr:hypothetical protein [Coraliomargarita sp. SDUM461004]MDQ8193234.1 hypothetical protein [Coraliomargarita sp. SDUM461004]
MQPPPKIWQWPNVLAFDAALIAALWLMTLERMHHLELGWKVHTVLALSVWLTYLADRLCDVKSRNTANLLSVRHRFSKYYTPQLWRLWFIVLIINLAMATQLTWTQQKHGAQLLAVCLVYTLLNQKLSRRFFPKESCVALIYAGGVAVFLPQAIPWGFFEAFAFLCLLNCLMIGAKERQIDSKMQVHSLATVVTERYLTPLALCAAGLSLWSEIDLAYELAFSFILIALIHGLRQRISIEGFRVLLDASLLIAPALSLGIR